MSDLPFILTSYIQLVRLLIEHGADPEENDAEAWARPRSWARKWVTTKLYRRSASREIALGYYPTSSFARFNNARMYAMQ